MRYRERHGGHSVLELQRDTAMINLNLIDGHTVVFKRVQDCPNRLSHHRETDVSSWRRINGDKLWTNEWLRVGLRDFSQMGEWLPTHSGESHWELWVISCSRDRWISGESHSGLRTSGSLLAQHRFLYKIVFHLQYAIERDTYSDDFDKSAYFANSR